MITLFVLMMCLALSVIRLTVRFTWGTLRFLFGLGLFFCCPLLFVPAAVFGLLGTAWLPILFLGILMFSSSRRI